ncbi:SWR1-complex protein 7 [Maudiozyma exigua]|uniref:SWR1-complex protein 7 n=1 Tax=Maudiozyma exigua TaxID=34358 RepID=A0A9P7BBM6_MAUEX|nr:SWR1-complex protein 7 [Kazachstania exigua]
MNYPDNVLLLLLQITLDEQKLQAADHPKLKYSRLLQEPIINDTILKQFTGHLVVETFAPELKNLTLRGLRSAIKDVFDEGIKGRDGKKVNSTVNLVTLANYYYAKRVAILESALPGMRDEIQNGLSELQD